MLKSIGSATEKIISPLLDEWTDRLKWAFWWPFIASWCLVNWKVILVIFSWNSKEIDDKIVYIESLFQWNSWVDIVFSTSKLIIIPLIMSWMVVWIVPLITRCYLERKLQNKKQEDEIIKRWIQSEIELIEKENQLKQEKERLKTDEERWEEELDQLKKENKIQDIIEKLIIFIYEQNGVTRYVLWKDLWALDALGLVRFGGKIQWNPLKGEVGREYSLYNITEKWKFFVKMYDSL